MFDVCIVDTDSQSYLSHTSNQYCLELKLRRSKSILLLVVMLNSLYIFAFY